MTILLQTFCLSIGMYCICLVYQIINRIPFINFTSSMVSAMYFFISYNAWYINTLASSRIDIYPNLIQCKICNITITLDRRFFTVYNLRLTFFNNTTSRFNRIDQETNKNNTKITWQIQVVLVEFNEQLSAQLHSIIYWMIFISQWVNLFQLILNWHLYQIATRHCNF
jgi:hypothetical protein